LHDFARAAVETISELGHSTVATSAGDSRGTLESCDALITIVGAKLGEVLSDVKMARAMGLSTAVFFIESKDIGNTRAAVRKMLEAGSFVQSVKTVQDLRAKVVQFLSEVKPRSVRSEPEPAAATGFEYHVYISAGLGSRERAQTLAGKTAVALARLIPGAKTKVGYFTAATQEELEIVCRSIAIVPLVTREYLSEPVNGRFWSAFERLAQKRGMNRSGTSPIIPVILPGLDSIPDLVRRHGPIDFSTEGLEDAAVDQIVRRVMELTALVEELKVRPDCSGFTLPDVSAFEGQPPGKSGDVTEFSVQIEVTAPDGLVRIGFELTRHQRQRERKSRWTIGLHIYERQKKNDSFADPSVSVEVEVSPALNERADSAAKNGLSPSQTDYLLGTGLQAAKAMAAGKMTRTAAGKMIQNTLRK
jgi:hypothetical protein